MRDITVRETNPSDLEGIFAVRRNPMVAPHQYPLRSKDTPERWLDWMSNSISKEVEFRCSTIIDRDSVIGHISRLDFQFDGLNCVQCGWNILPEYWGKGIMTCVLRRHFDQFFTDEKIDLILADCFRKNERCIRLLNRLEFYRVSVSLYERVLTIYRTNCWKWIRRYQMDRESWNSIK